MNPLKPGLYSTEMWQAVVAMGLGYFITHNVITASQGQQITDSLASAIPTIANAITAVGVLWVSLKPVLNYAEGRLQLKKKSIEAGTGNGTTTLPGAAAATLTKVGVVVVCLLFASGTSYAQSPSYSRTCLLPWRSQVERRLQALEKGGQQTLPAPAYPAPPPPAPVAPQIQILPIASPIVQQPVAPAVPAQPILQYQTPQGPWAPPYYANPAGPPPYVPPAAGPPPYVPPAAGPPPYVPVAPTPPPYVPQAATPPPYVPLPQGVPLYVPPADGSHPPIGQQVPVPAPYVPQRGAPAVPLPAPYVPQAGGAPPAPPSVAGPPPVYVQPQGAPPSAPSAGGAPPGSTKAGPPAGFMTYSRITMTPAVWHGR